jgi:soluble lytic murein transglycosylase
MARNISRLLWLVPLVMILAGCNLPAPIARQLYTPTPQPTATATATPTPTLTPTPTPTPTPIPAARVDIGDRWIFEGDYDTAEQEFNLALQNDLDPEAQFAAQLGLGRVYYLRGETTRALQTLRGLVDSGSGSLLLGDAYYFLGNVFNQLDRYDEAAGAFEKTVELKPGVLDAYLQEQIGDAYLNAGNYADALNAYEKAANAPQAGDRTGQLIKLARAYRLTDQADTALVIYQDISDRSDNDYVKAQMLLLMGQTYMETDRIDQAYTSYQQTVENYPLAYDSYTALVELVNNGVTVSELDRGLVDYFAGQYSVALAAFDRYIQSDPQNSDGEATAHYYSGMTNRSLGNYQGAIDEWDTLIANYPDSTLWDDAWEQKGYTQWAYLDQYPEAVQTFLDFVETAPDHALAPQFLSDAARVAERNGDLQQAATLWDRVTIDYPNSDSVYDSSFQAGITYYRLGDYEEARTAFERAQSQGSALAENTAALFWVGKSYQALGKNLEAGNAWQQAALLDPTGYYAERSKDLLTGRAPFTAPEAYDFSYDQDAEKSAAEDWIRTAFNLPEGTDLSGPGPLASDPRFLRGKALWELGMYDEARLEFEDLRLAVESDPANTYRLGQYLINTGLYRSGVIAIRQVLNLAGLDDAGTLAAPKYFNRLRFGAYFSDLIIPAAQEYGFHPLFLFSVARQESLFEGFVRSSAGARGVMQIIPSTGDSIAAHLGWPPNFTEDDLYRPFVNITLGTEYLSQQRDFFDGDLYAALAAYNGGPGNAQVWKELASNDPDLFLEVIRFDETRRYIRSIYEIYNIYFTLYDRSP